MAWEYKREESQFAVLPEGRYKIRIKSADKVVAKTGRDMISFCFEVSGKSNLLFHNIVFLEDRPEITNRSLTQFFDSFKDIPDGDFNLNTWVGKVGACTVKHEEYNGETRAKIGYFIPAKKQGDLPAWQEPPKKEGEDTTGLSGFVNIPDSMAEELPFA